MKGFTNAYYNRPAAVHLYRDLNPMRYMSNCQMFARLHQRLWKQVPLKDGPYGIRNSEMEELVLFMWKTIHVPLQAITTVLPPREKPQTYLWRSF
ncbi:hypothetical protein AVEN_254346-1 [Araneus ventricosus]|uniref:Uncharacterized protein n=1 Tax=Araneus ventricosus TaxID=182803 RepID=A0A4Y2JRZ8_ARAVE|nr:hypothetical protein AVEN_254346-1 [Araneus ventricosus]